jgi:minichromosome maintenance protein 10
LGRGLNDLRNKVLGKSEVFYAGQSFTAIKATKNPRLVKQDQQRLMTLSDAYQSPFGYEERVRSPAVEIPQKNRIGLAPSLDVGVAQRKKDLERLKLLSDQPSTSYEATSPVLLSKKPQPTTPTLSAPQKKDAPFTPKLTSGNLSFELDLTSSRKNEFAKQKALEILKKKPIQKVDPNFVRHRGTDSGKKRALEELNNSTGQQDQEAKKQKLYESEEATKKKQRILEIMNAKSSHTDLIEAHEQTEQEKYFKNLERKENLEEKMLKTTQIECKAVVCLNCKYIAFSAADRCKEARHEIRVKDAIKRFYKCLDCGNRTVTLHKIPKTTCKNCQSSRWERCGMMRDKDAKVGEKLSIRGDEEMFIGSASELANINLLVPDE